MVGIALSDVLLYGVTMAPAYTDVYVRLVLNRFVTEKNRSNCQSIVCRGKIRHYTTRS